MTNPFYRPGKQRASGVRDLFAAIAGDYDRLNDLLSLGLHRVWKRRAAAAAGAAPGLRVLDVCCGTGDIAFAMARRGANVVGLDFSEPMLAIARIRAGRAAGNPEFVHGDAQHLPFSDNTFDSVTVGYGLRNLASWETGLAEMCRVARPGGRVVVLDFGKPEGVLWRAVYFTYLRLVVPAAARLWCGNADAYAYILESLDQYPAQRGVTDRMRQLGLEAVALIEWCGGAMTLHCGRKPPVNR